MMQHEDRDEINLSLLREFTLKKSYALFEEKFNNLLEIGPPRFSGSLNSTIYKSNPQWYFNMQELCEKSEISYSSLDIDESVNPTFLGSIENPNLVLKHEQLRNFSRVVAFSILEHVSNPFLAIQNIRRILSVGGEIHLITPWDLRFHGPRPDCWRISDDAYRHLLQSHFEIKKMEFLDQAERPLSPIAIYVVASRLN
jgi:hypothetical protein